MAITSSIAQESIYVFTQKKDVQFVKETLPQLKAYAAEKGIDLLHQDILMRVPMEITATPAIIYQNPKGRAIYAGRYTVFSSIENFIRNNRNSPKASMQICKKNEWYKQVERFNMIASTKITTPKGPEAKGKTLNQADLIDLSAFKYTKSDICINKTDRNFYLDFHPYFDNGKLYLTYELFSQFDCIKPIYSKMNEPIIIENSNLRKAFAQASAELAKQIELQLSQSKIGEALTPIAANTADKMWPSIVADTSQVSKTLNIVSNYDISGNWKFASAIDEDTPIIQFNFKAPLDRYIGEVKALSGQFEVDNARRIVSGKFIAQAQSLTMGVPDFDQKIHKKYIKAFKYPEASFEFDTTTKPVITLGETQSIPGTFTLMSKSIPITVQTTFDAINDNQLQVNCKFEVNIMDPFKVKGPDGPAEASEVVEFNMNFIVNK